MARVGWGVAVSKRKLMKILFYEGVRWRNLVVFPAQHLGCVNGGRPSSYSIVFKVNVQPLVPAAAAGTLCLVLAV